ncbi:ABC transporter permease [Streptomyces sp. SBST2-5]|uniref:ABC transporter permease n=1 Tax=Streptomyces composti TaxID=2720025 RepID=A0ABX1AAK8_9ACTN|nr:ABC transporter permease [Streptomyces composti]NJP50849.1 ABC transporter permease [Streptomyces composti]
MPELASKTDTAVAAQAATTTDNVLATDAGPAPGKPRSLWSDAWYDLRHNWMFLLSTGLILLLLVVAAVPDLFISGDVSPRDGDLTKHYLQKPELGHVFSAEWLGYDHQGRSIYARLLHGTRASILVGVMVTVAVTLLGGLVGLISGYFGGWVDSVMSRITDVFFGIPFLLGAMVVLNTFSERSVPVVSLSLAVLGWTSIARVMRGSVITVKQADYVTAAKALGAGTGRILFKHILPNAVAPVIVVATIALGGYITAEATLSFLGIGLTDSISWGQDISAGKDYLRTAQYVLFFPAAMLSLTVLAFLMFGDAVRNALDPKSR